MGSYLSLRTKKPLLPSQLRGQGNGELEASFKSFSTLESSTEIFLGRLLRWMATKSRRQILQLKESDAKAKSSINNNVK